MWLLDDFVGFIGWLIFIDFIVCWFLSSNIHFDHTSFFFFSLFVDFSLQLFILIVRFFYFFIDSRVCWFLAFILYFDPLSINLFLLTSLFVDFFLLIVTVVFLFFVIALYCFAVFFMYIFCFDLAIIYFLCFLIIISSFVLLIFDFLLGWLYFSLTFWRRIARPSK